MNCDLTGQVVLITGASGGIGQATARAFAEEGAKLVLHYHQNEAAADELADALDTDVVVVGADLRDEAQVGAMYDAALGAFGRVDAIVVNAGVWVTEAVPVGEMSLDQWQGTLEADLTSAFLTCRGFLQHIRDEPREHASIVFVSSTAALVGEADHADYSSAKAAMTYGLVPSLKNEIVRLAPEGRVNAICPGWTNTPMAAYGIADEARMGRVLATVPLKKIASPEDCAHAIVFLTSDRLAGHLTGTVLPVAGGMEGRLLNDP